MSCPYYTFKDGDYHCSKSGNDVNSDIYYKYCRNYDYDDCPIYRGERSGYSGSSSGGCYLTSACVEARGLPDDCEELTVLRAFRDGWLREQPEGPREIAEYYETAPGIVSAIDAMPDAQEIWDKLYTVLVRPCVEWIQHGEMEKAHRCYRKVARQLEEKWLK